MNSIAFWIILVWLVFLTIGLVYLFVMNHFQQEINDTVDGILEDFANDTNAGGTD